METSTLIQDLNNMLLKKKGKMEMLLLLTKKQEEDIRVNEGENLNTLTDEKQPIMDEIDRADVIFLENITVLKKQLKVNDLSEIKNPNDFSGLSEIKRNVEAINSILRELAMLDMQIRKAVEDKMKGISSELRNLKQGQTGIKAYGGKPINTDGVYFDSKK